MHLDVTIHWCNLPAHFWRTNYCALVKQTIWNASLLNRACQGKQATPSLPRAFVLLLLVLSCICLLSEIKAHQLRTERRLCSTQGSESVRICICYQLMSTCMLYDVSMREGALYQPALLILFHMISCSNWCMAGEGAKLTWLFSRPMMFLKMQFL